MRKKWKFNWLNDDTANLLSCNIEVVEKISVWNNDTTQFPLIWKRLRIPSHLFHEDIYQLEGYRVENQYLLTFVKFINFLQTVVIYTDPRQSVFNNNIYGIVYTQPSLSPSWCLSWPGLPCPGPSWLGYYSKVTCHPPPTLNSPCYCCCWWLLGWCFCFLPSFY